MRSFALSFLTPLVCFAMAACSDKPHGEYATVPNNNIKELPLYKIKPGDKVFVAMDDGKAAFVDENSHLCMPTGATILANPPEGDFLAIYLSEDNKFYVVSYGVNQFRYQIWNKPRHFMANKFIMRPKPDALVSAADLFKMDY